MLSNYFAAFVVFSAITTVLSAPVKEARDVESHFSPRNFYWQCPQGQSFAGNAPPGSNPGSCTTCQPGTFSPDGVNCYATPMGFYNNKAGAFNPIGCLAGTYTSSTGSKVCQPCTAPLMSYAASTQCVPCGDGFTSTDAQYCHACPAGHLAVVGGGCFSGNYKILIRDASDTKTYGYLSKNEDTGFLLIENLANALTVWSPTLGSTGPVPLLANTKSGTSGYNLAIAAGDFNYIQDFKASTYAHVWITESESDSKNEYFASASDWNAKAEPNVWVLGSADANGRIPISLNFIGPNQSTVTCARFFRYYVTASSNGLGATCAAIHFNSDFDDTALLFLVLA